MSPFRLALPVALAALASPLAAAAARPIALAEARALSFEQDAEVLSLRAEVGEARARLAGASRLVRSNPELEGAAGPRVSGDHSSTDFSVALSQELEVFGQRGARMDAARAQLEVAEARLQARRVELAADVRERFAGWLAHGERARLADDKWALANAVLAAAEDRLESGDGSRIEVNAARGALGRAARERSAALARLDRATAELAVRLGLDPAEAIAAAGALPDGEDAPAPRLDALVEEALSRRPELRAARLERDAAEAERRLAAREAYPSPRLGVSYAEEGDLDGTTRITHGVLAFDLPFFDRNQEARGVAAARAARADAALAALERRVRGEVSIAARRLAAAREYVRTWRSGVLGPVEENVALAEEAYRAGKVSIFDLLDARREALEARMEWVDVREELEAARAGLARALGRIE